MKGKDFDAWVEAMRLLCAPKEVVFIQGTEQERNDLLKQMKERGQAIPLNPSLRPNSFLFRSDPRDVARVEEKTFICSEKEEDAGVTNHWKNPKEMKKYLLELFRGCMRGRTMYVIPFCLGPIDSPFSAYGVEISDSPYVAAHMTLMTHVEPGMEKKIREADFFVPCMHSVGVPLSLGQKDPVWPCNPEKLVIAHFPELKEVWSYGSGYGGNALLAKKCFALRIASTIAQKEGWLAEHMLIMKVTSPENVVRYIAAAFPSACGKTNLAMLQPALPGWKIETVGDDIAWLHVNKKGGLSAVNPEAGFFGVAPGTSYDSNPVAMETISKNTLFTNVALTEDGDVYWEKKEKEVPSPMTDWLGEPYDPSSGKPAAHPNARFTVSIRQCPILDKAYDDKEGVPIDAIIFGGRRASEAPLIMESKSWEQGVFYGATLSSELTAAQKGTVGKLRHDPFAMLPFCGYNMGDYFNHWLEVGKKLDNPPKIFSANWFLKDIEGNFIWPGFGDNIRVIEWIFKRLEGAVEGLEGGFGVLPKLEEINWEGLDLGEEKKRALFHIDEDSYHKTMEGNREYFHSLGERVPGVLLEQAEKTMV